MNYRNSINFIFFIFALIHLSPSVKATEFSWKEDIKNLKPKNDKNFTHVSPNKAKDFQKILSQTNKNNYSRKSKGQIFKNSLINSLLLATKISNSKNEVEIQSDIQSEENNILNAEGNVIVSYKGNILKTDSLIYDKTNKTINAKGNISLNVGEQIFKMASFKYDFHNKKGYLLEVEGLIKTDNLIDDLLSNFENGDIKEIETLNEIKKNKVLNTPNKVENWVFLADKIEVDGNIWKTDKAIFTNDLLELKQVNIAINSLEAIVSKEELRFTSSLSYLILDEKIHIPFWVRDRTLTKSGENFNSASKWNFGFDNIDRDGLFIGRKLNSINLFDDFVLDLEPQFLIQRSLKGQTKSFVKKGDSITADKVNTKTTWEDYFGLNSQIKGKISKWNIEIDKQINSFESEKFSKAIRVKANLNKEITFLNSKWDKIFYGVFRDRIWNGSIGEAEIYTGYGSKLEKQNTWEVDGISKTEVLSFGLANLRGEALNNKNLVTSLKGNFFYSLEQKFPIRIENTSKKYVDISYKYIPVPIKKGVSLNTKIESLYSLYEGGSSQGYIGFGVGPEFIFGNFKNKFFDYTRISLLPSYKIKDGDSMFKFDQISDKFILDIDFDQQLFGPLILRSKTTLNLDSNSNDHGDFIKSKVSLDWKKRSYEFGVFYQPHNESGGINFTLFGFE